MIYFLLSYGNLVPCTKWGKIVTMLYAVFGIPVYVLYFLNMGKVKYISVCKPSFTFDSPTVSGAGKSLQMGLQEDLLLRHQEEQAQPVRGDGEQWRHGGDHQPGSHQEGGGGLDPQHGLCLGDALLPHPRHRHVRRVGALGLPGQSLLLCHLALQGQSISKFWETPPRFKPPQLLLLLCCFML